MKYTITIPKPCTENWNDMTPTEKGMFCNQCSKGVIDFTNYSNYGLAKLIDSNEKICGRFKPKQLNREFSSLQSKSVLYGGLTFGIVSLLSLCTPVQAQNTKPTIEITEQSIGVVGMIAIEEIPKTRAISGVVLDNDNVPLPGANVIIKGSYIRVQTDFDGKFSITMPTEKFNPKTTLITSYLGYQTKEITVSGNVQNITLIMSEDVMGEIIIIRKRNILNRIGNLFRKNR